MTRRRSRPRTGAARSRRQPAVARASRSAAARAGRSFAALVEIMATLRSAAGCPWDREQTPQSLRPFLLEETYEALDAIDRSDFDDLRGELGDVLFQCVFQAQIAAETRRFDITASIQSIIDKLIRRHPHVFKNDSGNGFPESIPGISSEAVLVQWEQIKAREQQDTGAKPRVLAGVPKALPALLRAHEISTRAAAVGFDWPDAAQVMDKIEEEVRELRAALEESPARAAEELGDLLFALVNLARKLGLESESALRVANDKFTQRFSAVETDLESRGRSVHVATLEEMEAAWTRIKKIPAPQSTTSAPAPSRSAPSRRRSRG